MKLKSTIDPNSDAFGKNAAHHRALAQQLRERVAELAVAGAEKILRKEINASAHADMLVALKQDL